MWHGCHAPVPGRHSDLVGGKVCREGLLSGCGMTVTLLSESHSSNNCLDKINAAKIPALDGGEPHKAPPLTEELLEVDGYLGGWALAGCP